MKTFIFSSVILLFSKFLFAQEEEGIEASPCVWYPPQQTVVRSYYDTVISIKMDQKNWWTDLFFSEYPPFDRCVRLAPSGDQIILSAYNSPTCGSSDDSFLTTNWTKEPLMRNSVIHLLIQILEIHIEIRLMGHEDTHFASIPIANYFYFGKAKSSSEIMFNCYKDCPLEWRSSDNIQVANKTVALYGLESPFNLIVVFVMSNEGKKENRDFQLPFRLENHTWYEVTVKTSPRELMVTINDATVFHEVATEKIFSVEETYLKTLSRSSMFYTYPNCTLDDQEGEKMHQTETTVYLKSVTDATSDDNHHYHHLILFIFSVILILTTLSVVNLFLVIRM